MSEDRTKDLTAKHSFEEKVLARLDAIDTRLTGIETRLDGVESRLVGVESRLGGVELRLDGVESRLDGVESRLQTLESKQYDTKPIWERALKEITETRREMLDRFEVIEASINILSGDVTRLRSRNFTIKQPSDEPESGERRA